MRPDPFGEQSNTEQTQVAASAYFLSDLGSLSSGIRCWARAVLRAIYDVWPQPNVQGLFFSTQGIGAHICTMELGTRIVAIGTGRRCL